MVALAVHSYKVQKGSDIGTLPPIKKNAESFYPRSDCRRLRFDKGWRKVVFAVILVMVLGIFTRSREMLVTSIKYARMDPDQTKGVSNSNLGETRVKGGKFFKVPPTWNRYYSPWFCPPVNHPKTPKQSNHRYLYSPARLMTSDGIGHSMGAVNYEYNMALRLNLTYTHRVGFYSSLSRKNRYAVEDFFGWRQNQVQRKDLQGEGCEPRNTTWPGETDIYICHFCGKPRRNGKMGIKRVVNLPSELNGPCYDSSCINAQLLFVQRHHHSHTIFQHHAETCQPPATDSNLLETKNMFYHNYWNRHGRLLWPNPSVSSKRNRTLRFDPGYLNIAMHIRRGDFLHWETRKKRTITKDLVFAKVLRNALSVVYRKEDPFFQMPTALHIYSEGKLLKDKVYSTHDVGVQDKAYYDSDGNKRDEKWWKELITQSFLTAEDMTFEKTPSEVLRRLRIYLHISEDTINSLHEMIAADIFIGSVSGLSVNLVWSMSRGVVLIPHHASIDNELGKKGEVCCSVPFENDEGSFSVDLFESYWRAYTAANGDSVLRSWLLANRKSSVRAT